MIACVKCDREEAGSLTAMPPGWAILRITATSASLPVCTACKGKGGSTSEDGDAEATDSQLKLFVERLERIREELRGVKDDERDTFSEAKAVGYDVKILREILKLRAMAPHDRAERDAILETYKAALGIH